MRKNFRSYNLAVEFYQQATKLTLPRHLKDQLNRASSSIALNLAEGSGKSTKKDQARFFDIAFASLRESEAILELSSEETSELTQLADCLAAHVYCLIKAVRKEI